jgi:broad specificity phosphatase PhoE
LLTPTPSTPGPGRASTMLVLLVRHAESANNVLAAQLQSGSGADAGGGSSSWRGRYNALKAADPPLSELGRQQAQRLASWAPAYLRSMGFLPAGYATRLVSSPMERSLATAAPLGVGLGLECEVWGDTHETKVWCCALALPPFRHGSWGF